MPLEAVELLDAIRRMLATRKHETQADLIVTYELHLCSLKGEKWRQHSQKNASTLAAVRNQFFDTRMNF